MSRKPALVAFGVAGIATALLLRRREAQQSNPRTKMTPEEAFRRTRLAIQYQKSSAEGINTVLPLTTEQVLARALFLVGQRRLSDLDPWVKTDPDTLKAWGYKGKADTCLPIYYQLPAPLNGGRNPRAPDPAARWHFTDKQHVNRTCDCSGGVAWMIGIDRYQPRAPGVIGKWGGWVNVDSKIADATSSKPQSFEMLDEPIPGCIISFASNSGGHKIGHEAVVISVPSKWDPSDHKCWTELKAANVASKGAMQANTIAPGTWWEKSWIQGRKTYFLKPIMKASV